MKVQIKINDEKETIFHTHNGEYIKTYNGADYYTTCVFYYKSFKAMMKAAQKMANEKSTITTWDSEGHGTKKEFKK